VVDQSGREVSWPVYFLQDSADNGISVTLSPGLGDAGLYNLVVGWCRPYVYGVVEVESACESGYTTLTVTASAPPIVTDVTPPEITTGDTSDIITITGSGFTGATPESVTIDGTGVNQKGFAGGGDSKIILVYSVDRNANPGPRTITIKNATGGSTTTSINVVLPPTAIAFQFVKTVISTDGNYSEDSTIQVTAVDKKLHTPQTAFTGTVNIAEDGTNIYSQNWPQGQSGLPASVNITSGGTATFVARSLAGPQVDASQGQGLGKPPVDAMIKSTNYPVDGGTSLAVKQWIISTPTLDPLADATVYDWFQQRILGIFSAASGDLKTVLKTISGYSLNGSIADGAWGQTLGSWGASQSPVQFNAFFGLLRLDSPEAQGNCGVPAPAHSLTNGLYHEARHAYQHMLTGLTFNNKSNDEDNDFLVNNIPIAPTDIIFDSTDARDICNEYTNKVQSFKFNGPNNKDAYGELTPIPGVIGVSWALEMDAWKFASQH
jgi:hypothetical protein